MWHGIAYITSGSEAKNDRVCTHKHFSNLAGTIERLLLTTLYWYHTTVYPKKYAHGSCFAVLCCDYVLTDLPISIRLTSLALWQSNDCPSASKQPLWIWVNASCEFIMNDYITTTKQSTTKPCTNFLGYTVCWLLMSAMAIPCRQDGWAQVSPRSNSKSSSPIQDNSSPQCHGLNIKFIYIIWRLRTSSIWVILLPYMIKRSSLGMWCSRETSKWRISLL